MSKSPPFPLPSAKFLSLRRQSAKTADWLLKRQNRDVLWDTVCLFPCDFKLAELETPSTRIRIRIRVTRIAKKYLCVHMNPSGSSRFGVTYPHEYARTTRIYLCANRQWIRKYPVSVVHTKPRTRLIKKIHSGERFQKDAVSVSGFTGFVWTGGRFA